MLKQKLRELRTKKKLTQKELSEKLGLSKNAVCEYEKGRAEPSIETLIKLSRIFEVSLDYLVGLEDKSETTAHKANIYFTDETKTHDSINFRLKELRKSRGLKQKDLAAVLQVSPQSIGYYENLVNKPDPETLIKIADYFNVSVDYLLGRNENFDTDLFTQEKTIFKLFGCLSADCRKTIIDTMRLMACPDKSTKPDKVKKHKTR